MMLLASLLACTWPALGPHEEPSWIPGRPSQNTWAHPETEGEWLVPAPRVTGPMIINGKRVPPEWQDSAPAPRK